MRQALRTQLDPSGTTIVDAPPKFLVVPAALETVAEQVVRQIYPIVIEGVNPFTFLEIVVEPRLTDQKAYYHGRGSGDH